jgi:hypothetical protein
MKATTLTGLVLAAGMCLGAPVFGQTREKAVPAKESQAGTLEQLIPKTAEASVREVPIDIDFPGGTLREYVAALREVTKPNVVNVVAPETVLNVRIGELSLRQVTIKTAVDSVEWAIEPRGTVLVQQIGPNSYGLTSRRGAASVEAGPSGPVAAIQVLSLKELTDPLPSDSPHGRVTVEADVVLTAVRTAVESTNGDQAELKYHADSGLLIVRGTPDQLRTAESVLERMQTDVRMRRKSLKEASVGMVNVEELRAETQKQEIRTQLLELNYARARAEVDQAEAMRKEGALSEAEYNSARAAMDRMHAEVETSRIDAATSRARLESILKRMNDAAGQQQPEARVSFPAGRSTFSYISLRRRDSKYLEGVGGALSELVKRLRDGEGRVEIEIEAGDGGMLTVTADEASHKVLHGLLIGSSAADVQFEVKGKPRAAEEKKAK